MRKNTVARASKQSSAWQRRTAQRYLNTVAIWVRPEPYRSALLPVDSRTLSPTGEIAWAAIQFLMLSVGVALVGLLLFSPALGLALMWTILIPVAPALVVIAPGLWRNICPMATVHQLPKLLGVSQHRTMPEWAAAGLSLIGVTALFIIVPMRHIGLNTDGPMTALMLILAAATAGLMGTLFEARSGWCTTLCPIHPVEKLYGTVPAVTFKNARCDLCENCTNPCPDSTPAMSPTNTGSTKLQKILGHFVVGSFPGFVWGWYQVGNYPPGQVGIQAVITAYAWPFGAVLVSYLVFKRAERALRKHESLRQALHRAFAAAAVSTYYWYSLPGVASSLMDLPDWFPMASRTATTLFFFWFLVFRSPKGLSWLVRPTMASAYWTTRMAKPAKQMLIHVGPTE